MSLKRVIYRVESKQPDKLTWTWERNFYDREDATWFVVYLRVVKHRPLVRVLTVTTTEECNPNAADLEG